jgi:hypothetical protein
VYLNKEQQFKVLARLLKRNSNQDIYEQIDELARIYSWDECLKLQFTVELEQYFKQEVRDKEGNFVGFLGEFLP